MGLRPGHTVAGMWVTQVQERVQVLQELTRCPCKVERHAPVNQTVRIVWPACVQLVDARHGQRGCRNLGCMASGAADPGPASAQMMPLQSAKAH